jgi:selenocysteine lyase/cysteine desulfurase
MATIGELCRQRGVIFAVDGIQAVGAVGIDVQRMKIDALAAGGQKWQMAPHGSGFLYLTDELQSRIQQQYLGWLAVEDPWNFHNYNQPLASSARRYEGGSLNFPGITGYAAAVATLLEFGIENIEAHLLDLTDTLIAGLHAIPGVTVITPKPRPARAGIVTIRLPEGTDGERVLARLQQEGILPAIREGHLRFSPHFYNTPGEMEQTIAAVRRLLTHP